MKYPNVTRRYVAALIDGVVIYLLLFLGLSLMALETSLVAKLLAIAVAISYEPIFTAKLCTLGQLLMRYRVRSEDGYQHIGILKAYGRFVVKVILGLASLLLIPKSEKKQALHDLVTGTIVLNSQLLVKGSSDGALTSAT